ncbi:MAG: flagellar hook-basal body complex protein FliE [Deltaproteobacteria bacterium]|nr:flagellar hook-basal body complex protein FliE [Deltaproteobacteria bacterium]MBW2079025.1 flagellar hook-basal body complex protein FliE [Deltaproteobacteria bacterium]
MNAPIIFPPAPQFSGGPSDALQRKEPSGPKSFFEKMLDETERRLKEADHAILKLGQGRSQDLHDVMIAMEKADLSLRLLVQVRNKMVDAYQEIMRMQV